MPAYKDGDMWRSQFYYTDWTGARHKKNKREVQDKKRSRVCKNCKSGYGYEICFICGNIHLWKYT